VPIAHSEIPSSMTILADESCPLLEADAAPSDRLVEASSDWNYRALGVAWVATATAIRLVCVAPLPLGNGEAYYYSWSRFLDWSYYDHPPLVAWMVRVTTAFGVSPATVRLGPVLAAGAFGLLFYRLAERVVRPRAAFFALVLITALPTFLASSFILNPEAPLAPLWVGFLLAVERMRKRDESFRPLVAGVLLGFAFLAKYTAVLLVPATLIYVAASVPTRRWLRRPSFYAGGGIALLVALPVLVWNAVRGWPSVRLHLLERASATVPVAGENTINRLVEITSSNGTGLLQSVLRVMVGQFMAYSPLLAPLLVLALVRSLRRARSDDRDLFITAFSWPVLLPLLAAMTAFKDAEQHWTMMAFIPAAIAAGRGADEAWSSTKRMRGLAPSGVALSGVLFVLAIVHAHTTALFRLIPRDHYEPHADTINELVGWEQVHASVAQAANSAAGRVVLAGNHYSLCGRLFFEMGDSPPVYCPTARRSAFDFFGRREPPAEATVISLTTDIHEELPAGLRDRSCVLADEVSVERAGRSVARYFVRSCAPAASAPSDTGATVAQLGLR
jgi:4-amino-4-deoxy-L-arabinose transferase-like glycosyltransferase